MTFGYNDLIFFMTYDKYLPTQKLNITLYSSVHRILKGGGGGGGPGTSENLRIKLWIRNCFTQI